MAALHALRGRLNAKGSGVSFDKAANFPLPTRDVRQEWIAEQLDERKRQRRHADDEKQQALAQSREQLWRSYGEQVARTHELNVAWKQNLDFFAWDRVLALEDLMALRITGHALVALPDALARSLCALTVLSLIASGLETLPENVRSTDQEETC